MTDIIDNNEYLRSKAHTGLIRKGFANNDEYLNRLNEELDTIIECGLSDFMLIVAYTVKFLKSHDIVVGPGRGSVGGSLVAWCIGITEIDSIKYGLSFARFLNKARMATSLGDIDIDISQKDRPRALELLKKFITSGTS